MIITIIKKRNLNKKDIQEVLNLLGYKFGLNRHDLEYLAILKISGPLSLDTIAKKLTMEKVNITSDIEPYLLKKIIYWIKFKRQKYNIERYKIA